MDGEETERRKCCRLTSILCCCSGVTHNEHQSHFDLTIDSVDQTHSGIDHMGFNLTEDEIPFIDRETKPEVENKNAYYYIDKYADEIRQIPPPLTEKQRQDFHTVSTQRKPLSQQQEIAIKLNEYTFIVMKESGPRGNKIKSLSSRLDGEPLEALRQNEEELCTCVDLENTIVLDYLLQENVLTQIDYAIIQEIKLQSDPSPKMMEKIVKIIRAKTYEDYSKFCTALCEAGFRGIVQNSLLTKHDVLSCRRSLARYLLDNFTDIHLYQHKDEEMNPIRLDELYVNLNWDAFDRSPLRDSKESLCSYMDILMKMDLDDNIRHVVASGIPGAGKTTFVKNVCYSWAKLVLQTACTDTTDRPTYVNIGEARLNNFIFVIPILLRLINPQNASDLFHILQNQFYTLSSAEILALINTAEKMPESILFILDGYDEMSNFVCQRDVVRDIIAKQLYPTSKKVITTRPHALQSIHSIGSRAVDKIAELLPMTEEQREEYIMKYFKYNPGKGQRLIELLLNDRKDLYEVSEVPIRMEMICTVWKIEENLGENSADLYLKFIDHLFIHLRRKSEEFENTERLNDSDDFLLHIGRFANTWKDTSKLETLFSYDQLERHFGSSLDFLINLGCITKYSPATKSSSSYWAFIHLTMQEFFTAFFLAKTSNLDDVEEFLSRCETFDDVKALEVIISFLCGLNAQRANLCWNRVIPSVTGKGYCTQLLDLFIKHRNEYKEVCEIDILFPNVLRITVNSPLQTYKDISEQLKSCQQNKNNKSLEHLVIDETLDISSMPQLCNLKCLEAASSKFSWDKSFREYTKPQFEINEMGNLMIGLVAIRTICCGFEKTSLQEIQEILITNDGLRFCKELDMSKNKLTGAGTNLGKLIRSAPELEVLRLENCGLESDDAKNIEKELPAQSKLRVLSLSHNYELLAEQNSLGELLKHFPSVECLQLRYTSMSDVSPCLKCKNLKALDVAYNVLNAFPSMLLESHMPLLEALSIHHNGLEKYDIEKLMDLPDKMSSLGYFDIRDLNTCSTLSGNDLKSKIYKPSSITNCNCSDCISQLDDSDLYLPPEDLIGKFNWKQYDGTGYINIQSND